MPIRPYGGERALIVVAGHLCLDVIPEGVGSSALEPGALVEVGEVRFAAGGAVANVGLALARLGVEVTLVGRVGEDVFGRALRSVLERGVEGRSGASLELLSAPAESTSYTIVLNPTGKDRSFLHHPGCNHTFAPGDLVDDRWLRSDTLHFGYPPLMAGVYRDGGEALASAFRRLRAAGVTVSLDLALPDPESAAGKVDWPAFLARVLPEVDLCLPSWDETCWMLEPSLPPAAPSPERLARLAERLLDLGPALVALKLGEAGLYLRSADAKRLLSAGRGAPSAAWANRELLSPNFQVEVRGTTGAGDATIAGLLAAMDRGLAPERALSIASAVGAASVQAADALGKIASWQEMQAASQRWSRVASSLAAAPGWREGGGSGVLVGPRDGMTRGRGSLDDSRPRP